MPIRLAVMSILLLGLMYVAVSALGNVMQAKAPVLGSYAYKALMFILTWLVVTAALRSLKALDKKARFWEKLLLGVSIGLGAGLLSWLFSLIFARVGNPDSVFAFSFGWGEAVFFGALALLATLVAMVGRR